MLVLVRDIDGRRTIKTVFNSEDEIKPYFDKMVEYIESPKQFFEIISRTDTELVIRSKEETLLGVKTTRKFTVLDAPLATILNYILDLADDSGWGML